MMLVLLHFNIQLVKMDDIDEEKGCKLTGRDLRKWRKQLIHNNWRLIMGIKYAYSQYLSTSEPRPDCFTSYFNQLKDYGKIGQGTLLSYKKIKQLERMYFWFSLYQTNQKVGYSC